MLTFEEAEQKVHGRLCAIFVYQNRLLKTKTKTLQAFSSDSTDYGRKGRPGQAPAWNRSDELIEETDSAVWGG